MKNISQLIEDALTMDPCLERSLNNGYANLSAIARELHKIMPREGPTLTSISSALKRRARQKIDLQPLYRCVANSSLTVKTGLAKISLAPTDRDLVLLEGLKNKIIGFSKGTETVTVLIDERDAEGLLNQVTGQVLERKSELTAIILRGPMEMLNTPGYMAFFLGILANKGISVDDIASSYVDVMIMLRNEDASRAFSYFSSAIEWAKRLLVESRSASQS
ncbi:MAG: ACT domain-containing protein [Thermoprotei archaeon]